MSITQFPLIWCCGVRRGQSEELRSDGNFDARAMRLGGACAVRGRTDINIGFNTCNGLVSLRDVRSEGLRTFSLYQVHRAPAESATRHPSATKSFERFGNFDHDVEFPATHLEEVAQTAMRFAHQVSKAIDITGAQVLGALLHPEVLGGDCNRRLRARASPWSYRSPIELTQGWESTCNPANGNRASTRVPLCQDTI
jgi:hypothetical protein